MARLHDVGGRDGYGRVPHIDRSRPKTGPWERRVERLLSLANAAGLLNLHLVRSARDQLPVSELVPFDYFRIRLSALESLLLGQHRLPDPGVDTGPAGPAYEPRAGDPVRIRGDHTFEHHRVPDYLRGRPGEVVRVSRRAFGYANDVGAGRTPARTSLIYTVAFDPHDVWGSGSAGEVESTRLLADFWAFDLQRV